LKLIRTSIFSGIITIIRIGAGFVASKVIAVITGPAGVAIVGIFTNFITITLTFSNGAINTGVIKYTAENKDDSQELKLLFSTSFKISISCSVFFGAVLIIFSRLLSQLLFSSAEFVNPILVLGATIILYSLNTMLTSILNGLGQIKTYTLVNTIGSVIGLLFTILLVYFYKIEGALYALVLAQSVVFFITAVLLLKSPWFKLEYFTRPFNWNIGKKLGEYSLMAIVTALTVPIAQILLRNMLIQNLGVNSAGYWQGMMRISDGYLLLITTSLSTYYLPKLSMLKEQNDLRKEIFKGYKIILPAVLFSCLIIYLLRSFIIKTLYTPEFLIMEKLFVWQLAGDFFKLAAWVLAYLMLAKSMTKVYIVTEIVFSLIYVALGHLFVANYGLIGISIAFLLTYSLYLFAMIFIFRDLLFRRKIEL
jgi:PST family polysaccharide transporter